MAEASNDEAYLLEEPSSIYSDEPEARPMAAEHADIEEATAEPVPVSSAYDFQSDMAGPQRRPRSPIVMLFVGLIIGAVIGTVAAYFALSRAFQSSLQATEPPALSEQKSNNVPLTSFEETRRLVDKDPVGYANAQTITPREAGDFFWLGRAYLLTGRPVEARRAFEQARSLLPQVQETANVKTMAHEIAMALAIVDSPQAIEVFKKEIDAANRAAGSNANTNASGPAVQPVR